MGLPTLLRRVRAVLEGQCRYESLVEELDAELRLLETREEMERESLFVRAAVEGEVFLRRDGGMWVEHVVRAKSPGEGVWRCIACDLALGHNLAKDLHCRTVTREERQIVKELGDSRVSHVVAWQNFASGRVEVP